MAVPHWEQERRERRETSDVLLHIKNLGECTTQIQESSVPECWQVALPCAGIWFQKTCTKIMTWQNFDIASGNQIPAIPAPCDVRSGGKGVLCGRKNGFAPILSLALERRRILGSTQKRLI